MKETIRNVLNTFEQVLPDKDVIGDPFWMLMNTDGKTPIEQNSATQNKILLFNVKPPSISIGFYNYIDDYYRFFI